MDDSSSLPTRTEDETDGDAEVTLDEVDRGVLYALQRDARNVTIREIAAEVEVSASTVRNRIEKLEESGVIQSYAPQIDYERAGFPLKIQFVCTADPDTRSTVAVDVLDVEGVVEVNEMVTSERNLHIQAVATATRDLTRIAEQLTEYGVRVHSSEIITNHYSKPWGHFAFDTDR